MSNPAMKIRLIWKDACSGAVRKPVLTPPVALGSDFAKLPEKLGQRSVARMAIADDQIKSFHALLMEERGKLIAIQPKDPTQTMADVFRSPQNVASSIQKQVLNHGDRFQLGTTPIMVQIATTAASATAAQATATPQVAEPDAASNSPVSATPATAATDELDSDERGINDPAAEPPTAVVNPVPSNADAFAVKPTKLLDPDLDEDDDMITANDAADADPLPASDVAEKTTKLLDPRLDIESEPDGASSTGTAAPATAAPAGPRAGKRAGGFVKAKRSPSPTAPASTASADASGTKTQTDAEIAKNGCNRKVGFLFKRRCGRFSKTDCPYCDHSNSDDYDPYEEDYVIYYEHYGDYSTGHWGSDYYAERDRYYYNRDAGRMDFTEADAASFEEEFDNDYEMDMGAS